MLWIQYLCHIFFPFYYFHALCGALLYQQMHITFAYMNLIICKPKNSLAHNYPFMPLILKPSFKLFNWGELWDKKFIALIIYMLIFLHLPISHCSSNMENICVSQDHLRIINHIQFIRYYLTHMISFPVRFIDLSLHIPGKYLDWIPTC